MHSRRYFQCKAGCCLDYTAFQSRCSLSPHSPHTNAQSQTLRPLWHLHTSLEVPSIHLAVMYGRAIPCLTLPQVRTARNTYYSSNPRPVRSLTTGSSAGGTLPGTPGRRPNAVGLVRDEQSSCWTRDKSSAHHAQHASKPKVPSFCPTTIDHTAHTASMRPTRASAASAVASKDQARQRQPPPWAIPAGHQQCVRASTLCPSNFCVMARTGAVGSLGGDLLEATGKHAPLTRTGTPAQHRNRTSRARAIPSVGT